VKHFTEDDVKKFEDMIRAMVLEPDAAEFRRIIETTRPVEPPGESFTDDEVIDYFGHFYEFIQDNGVVTIEPEYASETVRRFFDQRGPYGEIMRAANLPPEFVIIQRINLGCCVVRRAAQHGQLAPLSEEIWPFVAGPPATPMGEELAGATPEGKGGWAQARVSPEHFETAPCLAPENRATAYPRFDACRRRRA